MLPGGTIGAHYAEHSKMGLGISFTVVDDGTYINFSFGGTTYFRIRKSDGRFEVTADMVDNAF